MNFFSRFLVTTLLFGSFLGFGQDANSSQKHEGQRKHGFYFYWGYNRATYSKTNIHFTGSGYDFTIKGVRAKDRQSKLKIKYLYPKNISIPQYDYRLGYYLKNGWNVSVGFDHMKYVMEERQTVTIDGFIETDFNAEFGDVYNNASFEIQPDFLKFEHTDGLNYINFHLDKSLAIWSTPTQSWVLNGAMGMGAGILYPRSDVTLMHKARNDEWHLAGYGVSALGNLRVTFKKVLFLEYNLKSGFIHMPDVLTTANKGDKANHHFFFLQRFGVFGVNFRLGKRLTRES